MPSFSISRMPWRRAGRRTPASDTAKFVRVNGAGSPWHDADLDWLSGVIARADAVVLPKTERAADVERVAAAAANRGVIPMLETARGILHAPEILSARA